MQRRLFLLSLSAAIIAPAHAQAAGPAPHNRAALVRDLFAPPQPDYLRAKLAIDSAIDPSIDNAATERMIAGMVETARHLAGAGADEMRKLAAVRTLIYRAGPWNEQRPFAYDHADPYGRDLRNKLLATYLSTRRGNCVSMPILFLILADKLGANVTLSTAPLHVFIRHVGATGQATNLETTSGALPARAEWYRQNMPMTDAAVANGLYLQALSRRESVAVMASTLVEELARQGRCQDVIDVTDVLLGQWPNDVASLLLQASAYGRLLDEEFIQVYPTPDQIPRALIPRYQMLGAMNQQLFERAESLGWREPPPEPG